MTVDDVVEAIFRRFCLRQRHQGVGAAMSLTELQIPPPAARGPLPSGHRPRSKRRPHRSFLSAGALALRALPDDAEAVTRRAVEAARLALAFKHDPVNIERWLAEEQRTERWRRRQANERPDRDGLRLGIKYPTDEISETLGKLLGMLSDSAVHFTPEFLDRQSWRKVDEGGETVELRLGYFTDDQASVESSLSQPRGGPLSLPQGVRHVL